MYRRRTAVAALVAAPLMLAAVAACGGAAQPGAASPSTLVSDPDQRRLQFTRCLREHGLDVPDPGPNGRPGSGGGAAVLRSADPQKFDDAVSACRQYAGGANGPQALSEQDKQKMLTYTRCLRRQGVDISDPDPTTGLPQLQNIARLRNDPKFKEAQKTCAKYAPRQLGGGGR